MRAVCGIACLVAGVGGAASAPAQGAQLQGRLHLVWDGGEHGVEYFVVSPSGAATRLRVRSDPGLRRQLLELDRRLVNVQTADPAGPVYPTTPTLRSADLLSIRAAAGPGADISGAPPPQSMNFATVLCRFADQPATTPFSIGELEVVHGSTSPGLRFHYVEMSGDPSTMVGSQIVGWYNLPSPRSAYIVANNLNYGRIAQDCASLAQEDVNFPDFDGVNIQLNDGLVTRTTPPNDVLSFGGSWTLTLNGLTRAWGVTWLSSIHAKNYVVVHHELGHAVGWPHSSGNYGQEYDSAWDLMSRGYLRFDDTFGWQGIHTIAPHKDAVGWIPTERLLEPAPGTRVSARLMRSALPPPDGHLMVRLQTPNNGWYSVESRLPAGLDTPLPQTSVLIHHVPFAIRSYVVDATANNDPNDAGAQWLPGEEFTNAVDGVRVRVDSAITDGFAVTVERGWRLGVQILGAGSVTTSSAQDAAETCVTDCTRLFGELGRQIHLEASADPRAAFLGWSQDCSGATTCSLSLTPTSAVVARFGTAPSFHTTTLMNGTMGASYADGLLTDNGGGLPLWSLAAGSLPPGLTLSATTGTISGVPSAPGAFAFTLRLSSGPFTVTQATAIAVGTPTLSLDAVLEGLVGVTPLPADHGRFLDLLGNNNGKVDVGDVRAWLIQADHLPAVQREALKKILAPDRRSP